LASLVANRRGTCSTQLSICCVSPLRRLPRAEPLFRSAERYFR